MLLITFLAAALILVYVYVVRPLKFWTRLNVPCLEPTPIFGNFLQVFLRKENFAELVQKVYASTPKARFAGFYKFTAPVLLIKDPDLIPRISGEDFEAFPVHSGGDDSPALKDETWKTLRAALSLPSIGTKMRSLFLLMEDQAQELVHVLGRSRNTQTVEVREFFGRYANDVMAACILGQKRREKNSANSDVFGSICSALMKLFGNESRDHRAHFLTKETIADVVKDKDKEVRSDLLEFLIEARRSRRLADDANEKVPEDDVLAGALLSFVSGTHTAAALMCFLAYELAINPYVQRKLSNEVENTLRECDGNITYEALMEMTYLDMVVSETLRKWPPKPGIERKCLKDHAIKATCPDEKTLNLPKGTSLFVGISALHMDPDFYRNPELFDPERFNEVNKFKRNPCVYLPFGAGRRSCVGSHFALLAAKTVTFAVLSSFEIVPVEKTPVPMGLGVRHFDACTENGTRLGLKPRKSKVYY